ncbi:MAG: DUF4056 domain-containing protein [Tepidisphaeraceae bacterium]
MIGRTRILLAGMTLLALLWGIGGCAGPMKAPRGRLGALPFPGPFTLYRIADPQNLGQHRYARTPRLLEPDEAGHGILYTTRAGFLDIDHIRITIDTVRYCTERVRAAMRARSRVVVLETIEGSTFYVTLRYPAGWKSSSNDIEHERVADELAIRTGQRLGYLMMTWHEIVTWFGYRTVAFVDESHSSFTYDDTMSHVVGLRVAGQAMRDTSAQSFDEAVTSALGAELKSLGAVKPAQTRQASRAVENIWWSRGKPLKRQLDVGLLDDTVRPWLVPGLSFARAAKAEPFALPTLWRVSGRDFSGF